jgi:hypothetical protein
MSGLLHISFVLGPPDPLMLPPTPLPPLRLECVHRSFARLRPALLSGRLALVADRQTLFPMAFRCRQQAQA